MLRRMLMIISLVGLLAAVCVWAGARWGVGMSCKCQGYYFNRGDFHVSVWYGEITAILDRYREMVHCIATSSNPPGPRGHGHGAWTMASYTSFYMDCATSNRRQDTLTPVQRALSRLPLALSPGFYAVTIALWQLMVLFSILPALGLRSIVRHRRRIRKGLCVRCGYDLRASRERCPECGESVAR